MRETKVKMKGHKGITLMSLVITIIVLLILAGISIQMISGDNGILKQASNSKSNIDEAATLEYIKLSIAAARTTENNINKEILEKELSKYFDNSELIEISKNDYMIKINDSIYNFCNGEITSGYELKTTTDGVTEGYENPKVINSKIYGNSVQDGKPSPDNPVEIQSVGDLVTEGEYKDKYKIPVTVSGKNLFDIDAVSGNVIANGTAEKNNNGWKVKGNYGNASSAALYANGWFRPGDVKGSIYISAGQKVTISADVKLIKASDNFKNNNNIKIYLYGANSYAANNPQTLSSGNTTRVKQTYTVGGSGNYYPIFTLQDNELEITNIQIEVGDKNTDFEAYQKPQVNNIYLNEPLRKIGNYADYIDLKNKKVVRQIGNYNFNGNESWVDYQSTSEYKRYITNVLDKLALGESRKNIYSNYFGGTETTGDINNFCIRNGINMTELYLDVTVFPTPNDLKEWLSAHNTKIYYLLKEKVEETVEIPEILTHKGTNIITVDTQTKPSQIEITYYNLK